MNFITEKVNYGIMESLSQQVLFNTEQRNNKFLTLLILWMLDFTEGYAFKIFLFRNCDTWKPSCFNGTNLVLDVNLNKWKSSDDDCYLKLIYKLCNDSKSYELYGHFNTNRPYWLINTNECLEFKPEGTQDYIEEYSLLEYAKGYHFDSGKKMNVHHCYPSRVKWIDYSEDSSNNNCIACKEGLKIMEMIKIQI